MNPITTGIFPMEGKIAIIRPLLKKLSLALIQSSYRPVSNLSFLSKVVEKVDLDQFGSHCTNHRLIPDYQSAYHANYSCETALLKKMNYFLWAYGQTGHNSTHSHQFQCGLQYSKSQHHTGGAAQESLGCKGSCLRLVCLILKPSTL